MNAPDDPLAMHPEVGSPPCDEPCAHRERCGAEHLACNDFYRYVYKGVMASKRTRSGGREPTTHVYDLLFGRDELDRVWYDSNTATRGGHDEHGNEHAGAEAGSAGAC